MAVTVALLSFSRASGILLCMKFDGTVFDFRLEIDIVDCTLWSNEEITDRRHLIVLVRLT